jgi:toxin ParE1/3/4
MTADIIWTPLAREDLLDIYLAVAQDRPIAAERLFDRVEERIGSLAL